MTSLCLRTGILLALFSVTAVSSHAFTYYVSDATGNNANSNIQAQNIATPWKTIGKAASVMVPGDTCLIRGGTYRETVAITAATSAISALMTFQAYGAETVTLDGTDPVTAWTSAGGSIWDATMTVAAGNGTLTLGNGNQIFISGVMKPEARWPNAGATYPWQDSSLAHPTANELGNWSYANSGSYTISAPNAINGTFTDGQLPARAANYWVGATVNILSGYGWIMASPAVTAHNEATKTLTTNHSTNLDANGNPNAAYAIKTGNEFYITGKKGEMDSAGEWFYDPATTKLSIFSATTPTGVSAKRRNYGFNLSNKQNVKLLNLDFFACTVQTDANTAKITYDGLFMKHPGHGNIAYAGVFGLTLHDGDVLRNSELAWDSRGLIALSGSDIRVINNYLHDSGYMPVWEAAVGNSSGSRNLISHNTIVHTGRGGVGFPGLGSIVEYNDVSDAMKLTTDGAIFYTYREAGNAIARYNLLHDSVGPVGHTGSAPVMGFYLDSQNSNWIVHHNMIWNVPGHAMWINCRNNFGKIFNNTTWAATQGSLGSSFLMDGKSGSHIFNNLFHGPISGLTAALSDTRFNLTSNSGATNAAATDAGIVIPGITDTAPSVAIGVPDIGALESGGTDWRTSVGFNNTPPSPDPVYALPTMVFANQVKDGSFESGALAPNWTTIAGSNVTVISGDAWNNDNLRTSFRSLQFGPGTSELRQTVTGLLPNRRYRVFGGVRRTDAASTVKLGVRSYGYPALETTATTVNDSTDGHEWTMYNQSFITGAAATTAEIYLNVVIPTGGVAVYADDFCVELSEEPNADPVLPMPAFHLTFNETSGGTTAFDATTNNRNGTINGAATWTTGVYGNALNFDGVNDNVIVPGSVPTTGYGSVTATAWVRFEDLGTTVNVNGPTLVRNTSADWNVTGWMIKWVKSSGTSNYNVTAYAWDNTTPTKIITSAGIGTIAPGSWVHVAFSIDRNPTTGAGTIKSYLNGTLVSSNTLPAGFGSLATGLDTLVGASLLKGQLDDVRVYDKALDAAQIAAIKNADASKVMHLELDELAGATSAWDGSGNAKHGVLANFNTATAWGGGVLTFDGVNDVVNAPVTVPTTAYQSFTAATWVKFDALDPALNINGPTILRNTNADWAQTGWLIKWVKPAGTTNFNLYTYLWDNTAPTKLSAGNSLGAIAANTWVHVAFTVSRDPGTGAGTLTSYLNGAQVSSQALPAGFGSMVTSNATQLGAGGQTLKGQMDDVRIYSRALPWNEVLDIVHPQDGVPY